MKTQLLRIIAVVFTLSVSFEGSVSAQTYMSDAYGYACYNYFDNTTLSKTVSGTTTTSSTAGVYAPTFLPDPDNAANKTSVVVSSAAVNNLSNNVTSTRCLQSVYQATPNPVFVNNINTSDQSAYSPLNNNDWEWNILYKSNLAQSSLITNANTHTALAANTYAWRYWLQTTATNTAGLNSNPQGFFVTQTSDGKIDVCVSDGNGSDAIHTLTVSDQALTVGVTYAIKVQRLVGGYWKLYVNKYTTAVSQADSLCATIASSDYYTVSLSYANSALEAVNSSSAGNSAFQFDELHMYTRYLSFTGIASPANGVTPSPLYPNEGTVILYGYQLQMRGNYELGDQIYFGETSNGYPEGNFGSAKLYKTTNSYFSVSTATLSTSNFNVYNSGNAQATSGSGMDDAWVTSGNYDGSLSTPGYYFITAVMNSSISQPGTSISFSGTTTVYDHAKNSTSTPCVSSGSTTPSNIYFGNVWDWIGMTSTAWGASSGQTNWKENGSNVTAAYPQTTSDYVRIGYVSYSANNQPQLNVGPITVGEIEFGPYGSTSSSAASSTLDLDGHSLTANGGVRFDASASAFLKNSTATASTFTVQGTSTMASTSSLNFTSGTGALTFSNTGTFTLLSDASGSANIGTIQSGVTFSGTYTVQRYLSGGTTNSRGYRLLSSPVYAGNVTGIGNVIDLTYLKNFMLLSGSGGKSAGFDISGNPSLYLYRENTAFTNGSFTGGNFRGISSISTGTTNQVSVTTDGNFYVPVGNGYWVFYRGDRSDNLFNKTNAPYATAEANTLSTTGSINQGAVNVVWWYGKTTALSYSPSIVGNSSIDGFNMVGNPYPCSINWDTFSSSSSTAGIYGPSLSTKYYIYNPATKNYATYISGSGGVGTYNTTNANVIPSGQGFYVRAIASSPTPSITFNESAKTTSVVTSGNLTLDAIPAASTPVKYFRIKLVQDSLNYDYALFFLKQGASANYLEAEDALTFVGGGSVGLSSISGDNYGLAINSLPYPGVTQTTIPLKVYVTANGIYSLQMAGNANIPALFDIWLMDAYKKDSLDIKHNANYNFNVYGSDTSSYGSKRFTIVLRQNPGFAYRLLGFSGVKKLQGAELTWVTENEADYTSFTLERSTNNGATYDALTTVQGNGAGSYSYLDSNPVIGKNLYRLKQVDINNAINYSAVVTIGFANLSNSISNNLNVYPNPTISTINLYVTQNMQSPTAVYDIKILNTTGSLLKEIVSAQPTWQGDVSNLMPGTYIVQVTNKTTQTKVGTVKFVKQ